MGLLPSATRLGRRCTAECPRMRASEHAQAASGSVPSDLALPAGDRRLAVPTQHLEIERKFDVPPSFVLPDLAGTPGVVGVSGPEQRELEAVYYDTPDLRLARARVTMRR